MIEGVRVEDLPVREDERGYLYEVVSTNYDESLNVPHVYFAMARDGVPKAWHMHVHQTDRFVIARGTAKVGLVDLRGPIFSGDRMRNGANSNPISTWMWGKRLFIERISDGTMGGLESGELDRSWSLDITEDMYPDIEDHLKFVSPTFMEFQTVMLAQDRPKLLHIPPGVAHGQMGVGGESMILNMPTVAFNREDPDEIRMAPDTFADFSWPILGG